MKKLKTSNQWLDLKKKKDPNFIIMDPDGWDRKNYQYSFFEELISLEEFENRVMYSTCVHYRPNS